MSKKRYRPEDIIAKLREADILISQGKTVTMNHSMANSEMKCLTEKFYMP